MKISFLGDISLNDNYIELYKKGIDPFFEVSPILKSRDFVIGNLESIAKGNNGENELKQPRLTTSVDTLSFLKKINLRVATLAQNHIYDHLEDGFLKTTSFLSLNGIKYIGAGFSSEEASKSLILEKKGIKIGLLNYVTRDTNPSLPKGAGVKLNVLDLHKVINDILELKPKVDHVILLLHWGGTMERSMYPDLYQPKLARQLIDAGADLIVGHHSHTLQPFEIYKEKYVFYSLGNFCFADVNVNGKMVALDYKRSNPSLILDVNFEKTRYSIQTIGIINLKNYVKFNMQHNHKIIRQIVYDKNIIYFKPVWKLYFFYEKKIYPIIAYFFANNRNPIKQFLMLNFKSYRKHFLKFIRPLKI